MSVTNSLIGGCPSFKQIKTFSEIEKAVSLDASTLVLLDIDNTVLSSTTDYGTVEYLSYLVDQAMADGQKNEIEAKLAVHDRWIQAQSLVQTKLTDEKIGDFIKIARTQQVSIIGLTARLPRMRAVTLPQLARHGLAFDSLPGFKFRRKYQVAAAIPEKLCYQTINKQICPIRWGEATIETPALFASGIVFCHDLNAKGVVFNDWFKVFSLYRQSKGLSTIKKIIFVDDAVYNFDSMYQASLELGLSFYGFHFQYQNNFDAAQAEIQEKTFTQKRMS
ncbi:DUF2608 domain-containing protein [Candidatus Paracaedibacter symbiosus]|uniref:DUF2608 domain-containing protein n=1 Tax=Candidatus Paracaedibacter symbiosus TaxID=244582 RepID=UPI0005097513|nr:DUF2608 domain-containing protein [Candidatus Paracaedibacter symbiosus]